MDVTRIIVLVVAVVAAGGAAFLVRGMFGGAGDPATAAAVGSASVTEVLVAESAVEPGRTVDAGSLAWHPFPRDLVDGGLITREARPNAIQELSGAVTRAGLWPGEPVTDQKLVRTDSSGMMASKLRPGMRAISIEISEQTGAGGFILPDDRVDVILTRTINRDGGQSAAGETVLRDVRILAIDQTFGEAPDGQQTVVGKTATLELAPDDAQLLAMAAAAGKVHLALRGLGDAGQPQRQAAQRDRSGVVTIVRYGAIKRQETGN